MQKFSLELPKYRLAMHFRLIKRRKPLLDEPIVPTAAVVNKKYRSGTLLGKIGRYLSEHKSVKKLFTFNFTAMVIAASFLPSTGSTVLAQNDETIIQTQNTLTTEKSIQFPLGHIKINQGYSLFHPALDLGAEIGDPVNPVKPGIVTFAGFTGDGYGNHIIIAHGGGLESLYAHLSKIEVDAGDPANMDTEIGQVGISGRSTGPHLHLEIRQNGVSINPLNVLSR